MAKPVPDGYRTVTPHLTIRGAAKAIEFYKKAFGAQEINRLPGPDGSSIMHATIRIGESLVMLHDENPAWQSYGPQKFGGTAVIIHLYVPDADTMFDRAVKAGATATMPLSDTFWGDRYGELKDPFGHMWSIATHKEDLSNEEIGKRAEAFFATHAQS